MRAAEDVYLNQYIVIDKNSGKVNMPITQAMDALDAVKRLREADKLFIVHLKDVVAVGAHDTCAIGEGIVPCERVVRYLVQSGWQGDVAIEHEPFASVNILQVEWTMRSLDDFGGAIVTTDAFD